MTLGLVLLLAMARALPAAAGSGGKTAPATLLQADRVIVDRAGDTFTAKGDVEISRGERILLADKVVYETEAGVITARGNVSLLAPSGEVMFAENMKLSDDLANAAARGFRMLLTDRSRVAAAKAVRVDNRITQMRKVVYSPCRRCVHGPDDVPFWQLKADKVVHDQKKKTLTYEDARLEILGIPVVYTPYFEHPAPNKKRQTGLLTPRFQVSGDLGTRVDVPFYYSISKHRDLTVTPILTSAEGPALAAVYRARTKRGRYRLGGSVTVADRERADGGQEDDTFRGHIDAKGRFAISKRWRGSFDVKRASDDTYLRVYDFDSQRFLTSEAAVERFSGQGYFRAGAVGFQGTRRGDSDGDLPILGPAFRYDSGELGSVAGGRAFIEASASSLTRLDGRDVGRLGGTLGWRRTYRDGLGGTADLTAVVHADGAVANGAAPGNPTVDPPTGARGTETDARVVPQVAAGYSLPFQRTGFLGLGREVLTPRVQVVAGSTDTTDRDIPNEDSRDLSFDTTNLFSLNRFPGRDRISSGQRIDYALDYTLFRTTGGTLLSAVLGQSYRISADSSAPGFTGGDTAFSDIVGRVSLHPHKGIDLAYRYRLDNTDFELRRSEVGLTAGAPAFNVNLTYTLLEDRTTLGTTAFGEREELFAQIHSRIARDWSVRLSHRQDLDAGTALETEGGVSYHCDCFRFDLFVKRDDFRDRGVDSETSVNFRFVFEHLGAVGSRP